MPIRLSNGSIVFNDSTIQSNSSGAVRAWVRKYSGFDGQGNGIAASYNISSLTELSGIGFYRVSLSVAQQDSNLSVITLGTRSNGDAFSANKFTGSSSYVDVQTYNYQGVINNGRYYFGFNVAIMR